MNKVRDKKINSDHFLFLYIPIKTAIEKQSTIEKKATLVCSSEVELVATTLLRI